MTGVSYADGSAPLRSLEGGGDASKRRRAQGHCKFELRDSTVATDADMECAPTCWPFGAWRLAGGLPEWQALFSRITLRAASTVQAAGGDSVGLGPSDVQGHNCARLALTQLAALLRAGLGPAVEELEKEMLLTALGKDLYALG